MCIQNDLDTCRNVRVCWNRNYFYSSVHNAHPNHFVCTSGRNVTQASYTTLAQAYIVNRPLGCYQQPYNFALMYVAYCTKGPWLFLSFVFNCVGIPFWRWCIMNHVAAFVRLLALVTSGFCSCNNNNHLQVPYMNQLAPLITRSMKGMRKQNTTVQQFHVFLQRKLEKPLKIFRQHFGCELTNDAS